MAKDNTTKYIILGLLCHEAMTGYDVKKQMEQMISYVWSDISFGQIYPMLAKLEEEGLATKQVELNEDSPTRKIYTITDKGRAAFQTWLKKAAEKEVFKHEGLLKLFFGAQMPLKENIKRLQQIKDQSAVQMATIDEAVQSLLSVVTKHDDHLYYLLMAMFGQHFLRATLEWSDEAIELLENLQQKNLS
jgi:DNA-binding PadR family transcriptional regulator